MSELLLLSNEERNKRYSPLCRTPEDVLVKIFSHILSVRIAEQHQNRTREWWKSTKEAPIFHCSWQELQVCRGIWSVATRTPSLWAFIACRGLSAHEHRREWMDLCLARSASHPVAVHAEIPSDLPTISKSVYNRLKELAPRSHTSQFHLTRSSSDYSGQLPDHLTSPSFAFLFQILSTSSLLTSLALHFSYDSPMISAQADPLHLPCLMSIRLHGHAVQLLPILQMLPEPRYELYIDVDYDVRADTSLLANNANRAQGELANLAISYWKKRIQQQASRAEYALAMGIQLKVWFRPDESSLPTTIATSRKLEFSTLAGDTNSVMALLGITDTVYLASEEGRVKTSPTVSLITMLTTQSKASISNLFLSSWTSYWDNEYTLYFLKGNLERMKASGHPLKVLMIDAPELADERLEPQWITEGLVQEIRKGVVWAFEE